MTQTEQNRLEQAAMEMGKLEYLICLYTGLRVGELCALRWEDIDFENHILHVKYSVQRLPDSQGRHKTYLTLSTPKSESSIRDIPLPHFLVSILLETREKQGVTNGFMFSSHQGQYCDPRTMQHGIGVLCSGLGIQGVHMHTLRHTFATRCLEKEIRYEILCELLGHSSPRITLQHYAHCTPKAKRESMERLNPMI